MKCALLFFSLALSACGLDPISIANRSLKSNDYHTAQDCQQMYTETAYLENHSGQTINVTLSYPDYSDTNYYSTNKSIAIQIPAGGTWNQPLTSYSVTVYGTHDSDNNAIDATCSSTPQTKLVDLSTIDGVGTVRLCRVKTGVAYVLLPSQTCPSYTAPL